MTKIEINNAKELIGNFMGFEKVRIGYYDDPSESKWQRENMAWLDERDINDVGTYLINKAKNKWYLWNEVEYHKSYEWLKHVVEKIEKMDYGVKMCRKVVEIYIDSTKVNIIKVKEADRQQSLLKAVLEFIKYYNEQNKRR